jgi:hypothetical protein
MLHTTKRSNYDELSKLARERRVVRVLTEEHDGENAAAAIAKSKRLSVVERSTG